MNNVTLATYKFPLEWQSESDAGQREIAGVRIWNIHLNILQDAAPQRDRSL